MNTRNSFIAGFFLLALFALPGVAAMDGTEICRENGQRYDSATWQWNGASWTTEYERPGVDTLVTGDATAASWESTKSIRAVFAVRESGTELVAERVKEGTIAGPALQTIVLCQRGGSGSGKNVAAPVDDSENGQRIETDIPEVPEFGGILAVGTIGLLGAALVIAKRS